jgi:hypothetical protein
MSRIQTTRFDGFLAVYEASDLVFKLLTQGVRQIAVFNDPVTGLVEVSAPPIEPELEDQPA